MEEPILQSTLTEEIFTQQAVIERESVERDRYGGLKHPEAWTVHVTVPCRIWWWKGPRGSDHSPSEQYARPQATLSETGGEMALPLGTDVSDEDRIARVQTPDGTVIQEGPFRIIAVNPYESHIELTIKLP